MLELNVGGRCFATHQSTLEKFPDSLLCMALRNASFARDPKNRLFFDRDPDLFARLLNLLRGGSEVINHQLALEAEYYCLPFKQNVWAVDTADGAFYLTPTQYSKFTQEIPMETIGPNGHPFFACTKQLMTSWINFYNHIVELGAYLFWIDHYPKLRDAQVSLVVNGFTFENMVMSTLTKEELEWWLVCYSDKRSLKKLQKEWTIRRRDRPYFNKGFVSRVLGVNQY